MKKHKSRKSKAHSDTNFAIIKADKKMFLKVNSMIEKNTRFLKDED